MEHQRKREENEKRQRLFAQLAAVEERVIAGSTAGGSTQDATQALLQASALLDSEFVIGDIKSANRELDFCEAALASCSDGVGGVISLKDIFTAFDKKYTDFTADAQNDLKKFCLTYGRFFVSCPPWQCLKIGLETLQPRGGGGDASQVDATQASQSQQQKAAAKRKSMAAADREAAAAERQANAVADQAHDAEQAAADERDLETTCEIHRVRKAIFDELHENGGQPIDYWRFVYDPSSKGKTFMNILHVNHILQQKEISLVDGNHPGTLFLMQSTVLSQTAENMALQSIGFMLTDDLYRQLGERYGDQ